MNKPIILLIMAVYSVNSCIPLGLGASGCSCQENPSCGQCFVPQSIPPVQQPCSSCAFSNDVQSQISSISSSNLPSYAAPNQEPSQFPTANNNYPQLLPSPQQFSQQQPIAIPISIAQSSDNSEYANTLESNSNNYINEKDQQLHAITEFNEKEGVSVPFPGDSTTQSSHYSQSSHNKKPSVVLPPSAQPPVDEYSGLPAIYFTTKPNQISIIKNKQKSTTTTEQPSSYDNEELSTPQKANISIQTTTSSTTTKSTSSTMTKSTPYTSSQAPIQSTKAYAFASGTYWAVLEERETENGVTQQRRIPYHSYQQEVCTGATLGRSIEKDLESVALKCTMIGCAAVNVRPVLENADQYEAIYLKNVTARRKTKVYTCISIVDVPVYEQVYQKKQVELQSNRRRMAVNQPTRLHFASIEPKGIY